MGLGWPASGTPDVAPLCKLTVKFNYPVEVVLWRAAVGGAARGAAASSFQRAIEMSGSFLLLRAPVKTLNSRG